jgi:hypothetical protein
MTPDLILGLCPHRPYPTVLSLSLCPHRPNTVAKTKAELNVATIKINTNTGMQVCEDTDLGEDRIQHTCENKGRVKECRI